MRDRSFTASPPRCTARRPPAASSENAVGQRSAASAGIMASSPRCAAEAGLAASVSVLAPHARKEPISSAGCYDPAPDWRGMTPEVGQAEAGGDAWVEMAGPP